MQLQIWQIIILTLLSFIGILDIVSIDIGIGRPIQMGFLTGLVLGNVTLGLAVGATLQLMLLGVESYGGASVPDFKTGALLGTVFGVLSGKDVQFAIGLAVPIGLLMVQLDVLARFSNTFLLHKVDKCVANDDIKGADRYILAGILPWGLSRALPVALCLIFGQGIIDYILKIVPDWLMNGLSVAGGLLPVVGIAILLKYLPTGKNINYAIIGFVLAAYLKVPMIGIALVGVALAFAVFKSDLDKEASHTEEELEDEF
ncbi:PTS sorbose transporter subunit IIC [Enterococcus casseliflavus]|nr:PTS sorbose transporter subunit IIC [Enterococcus casseliflavus]